MLIKCIFGIITQCFYAKQISSSVNQSEKKYAKKKKKTNYLFYLPINFHKTLVVIISVIILS